MAADPLARAGIESLLAGQPGCVSVGQSGLGPELLDEVEDLSPDVILCDFGWSVDEAVDALAELEENAVPVLTFVGGPEGSTAALEAGATGVLPRESGADVLVAGIVAVDAGLTVLAPGMVPDNLNVAPAHSDGVADELTARERGVLALLAEGLPNKTIAARLDISEHTVKFHVNSILAKLGARSRTDAVVRATRQGLIFL